MSTTLPLAALAAAVLWCLPCRPCLAAEIPFAPPALVATADGPRALAAADVDGDGDVDLAGAAFLAGSLAWFENVSGDGSQWTAHTISAAAPTATAAVLVDLDADGDVDLLTALSQSNEIAWHENADGAGGAWNERTIATEATGALGVAAGDLDGDGALDVLSASPFDDKIAWYHRRGGAWIENIVTTSAEGAVSVAAADVDGDGDLDALAAASTLGDVAWYENVFGDATAWGARPIATGLAGAVDACPADVDGDGDVDVLSVSQATGLVVWYENAAGNGDAWVAHTISTGAPHAQAVFAADMDADGDLDVLGAASGDERVAFYENAAGDGTAWIAHTVDALGSAAAVAAADLDGDGDLDPISASLVQDAFEWHENRTIHRSALLATRRDVADLAPALHDAGCADVDRDGDADLLVAGAPAAGVSWWENLAGDGSAFSARTVWDGGVDVADATAADVDGDGDLDALAAAGASVWLLENTDGAGGAWSPVLVHGAGADVRAVAAADLDGDGDVDAVSGTFADGAVWWHENDGGVWTRRRITALLAGTRAVLAADVDRDGDVDVVSASSGDDRVAWHENGGGGGSWVPRTVTNMADGAAAVAVADVDRDGDLDIASVAEHSGVLSWHENLDGEGTLWSPHPILTANAPGALDAADPDADGDADLLFASGGGEVGWVENRDGAGAVWLAHLVTDAAATARPAFGEVDGDGRLDVVVPAADGTLSWFPDRGGQLALATTDVAPDTLRDARTAALLAITATHRGRPGDRPIDLTSLRLRLSEGGGAPLQDAQAAALLDALAVWRDSGSGVFESTDDALVEQLPGAALELIDGFLSVPFADADPLVRVALGQPRTFFVTVTLAPDASQQRPAGLALLHVTDAEALPGAAPASSAEDGTGHVPVQLEHAPNTGSSPVLAVDGWTDLGFGLPGTLGVPSLAGVGTLQPADPVAVTLAGALPDAPFALGLALVAAYAPFKGGTFVPSTIAPGSAVLWLATDGAGGAVLGGDWPDGMPAGLAFYLQVWQPDAGGPLGYAASNAVAGEAP